MDLLLSGSDLVLIIGLAVVLGALGGLTSDLVDPLKQADDVVSTDLDNRLTLPYAFTEQGTGARTVDAGFFGPLVVGVVGSLILVFAIGVSAPSGEDAAVATARLSEASVADQVQAGGEDGGRQEAPSGAGETDSQLEEARDQAAEDLDKRVPLELLIPLALVGGFAGPLVLRTARRKLTRVLDVAVGQARNLSAETARITLVNELRSADALSGLDDTEREQLVREVGNKVQQTVQETTDSVLAWEPGRGRVGASGTSDQGQGMPEEATTDQQVPPGDQTASGEGEGSVDEPGGDGDVSGRDRDI